MEVRGPPLHLLHGPALGGIGTRSAVGHYICVYKKKIGKARGP